MHPAALALIHNRFPNTPWSVLESSTLEVDDGWYTQEQRDRVVSPGRDCAIVSDYDADGICSAVIMAKHIFRTYGVIPEVYFPDRMTEGYGLDGVVDRIRPHFHVIVLDCGTNSRDAIQRLLTCVTVVDHHLADDNDLPEYIINPTSSRKYCTAHLLYQLIHGNQVTEDLHLAALATITDCCDMRDPMNRALVKRASQIHMTNPGLIALNWKSDRPHEFTEMAAGFNMGPTINAAGRIDSAHVAFEALMDSASDSSEIENLKAIQEKRKLMTDAAMEQVQQLITAHPPHGAAVYLMPDCHPGIVGIIAARVSEICQMPAIIACESNGQLVGSGRSYGGLDLHRAMESQSYLLKRFGGHAEACGFALEDVNWPEFRIGISSSCLVHKPENPPTQWDLDLGVNDATMHLLNCLEALRPYGQNNKEPVFRMSVRLAKSNLSSNGKHVFGEVECPRFPGKRVSFVAFNRTELPAEFTGLFTLQRNEYRGRVNPQLHLKYPIQGIVDPRFISYSSGHGSTNSRLHGQ